MPDPLLGLLIALARVVDVTLGTLRIVFIARERKLLAAVVGFFEVLVWVLIIGTIMQNLDSWWCYLGYAFGFAAGNWLGLWLQGLMALGDVAVRIITARDASILVNELKRLGYGVTSVPAYGALGPVSVFFVIVHRCDLGAIVQAIAAYQPGAFYTVEDVRAVSAGIMPPRGRRERLEALTAGAAPPAMTPEPPLAPPGAGKHHLDS